MSEYQNLDRFGKLVEIIARLRSPDGCPWDRRQTHSSLREFLLEECYEALEALDEGDTEKLKGELGDILLQIMLHAQIASDAGEFDIGDVIKGLNEKMIYRHPHVFGTTEVSSAEEVSHNWQALKSRERGEDTSILESVPKHMPSMSYAYEIQQRVAQVGFDWEDLGGVIDKIAEEAEEFRHSDGEKKSDEFGDLLFTLVNFARRLGIDSEIALREANRKFFDRFTTMEKLCRERGLTFDELSFKEQNALWEEVKEIIRKDG
ncbi:MAG: nucleoside triphosphate pyrophosphohydrolase [Chloroflexi bacterium RBG_13_46_14]|nr:MAG: nucleoside triphosphate pyrophosphohydrolase [Chloroflexi bacterium RBG_13_46_14]